MHVTSRIVVFVPRYGWGHYRFFAAAQAHHMVVCRVGLGLMSPTGHVVTKRTGQHIRAG